MMKILEIFRGRIISIQKPLKKATSNQNRMKTASFGTTSIALCGFSKKLLRIKFFQFYHEFVKLYNHFEDAVSRKPNPWNISFSQVYVTNLRLQ